MKSDPLHPRMTPAEFASDFLGTPLLPWQAKAIDALCGKGEGLRPAAPTIDAERDECFHGVPYRYPCIDCNDEAQRD